MADTNIEIRQGREVVGSMGSAMGGQMYIAHGKCLWAIDKQMLWDAFLAAEKEQYLEPDDPEVCDCQNFPTHISNACPIHG